MAEPPSLNVPALAPAAEQAPAPPEPLRLFLALWPDPALQAALHAWSAACTHRPGAAPVPAERLHLTLHFLGNVARGRLPDLKDALRVPFQPFDLSIGTCERWQRGLVVALADEVPPELAGLHALLGDALAGLGLPLEPRAFRPHITLARRCSGPLPEPLVPPLRWAVKGYALVESRTVTRADANHGGYQVLMNHP